MDDFQKGCTVRIVRSLSSHEDAAIWIGYEGELREIGKDFYGMRLFDSYRRLRPEMHYFQREELEAVSIVRTPHRGYISGGR